MPIASHLQSALSGSVKNPRHLISYFFQLTIKKLHRFIVSLSIDTIRTLFFRRQSNFYYFELCLRKLLKNYEFLFQ